MNYLDWAATTPPDSAIALQALHASFDHFANPSSQHRAGKAARDTLEGSRASFLDSLALASGVKSLGGDLAFTASGTEADQIPLLSLLKLAKKNESGTRAIRTSATEKPHLVISAIEHAAIDAQAETLSRLGFAVTFVKPDADGIVRPSKIGEALRSTTRLVAVMAVNNETGAIQDIDAIGRSAASAASSLGVRTPLFHVDCVQALGKVPLRLSGGLVTSAAFSAHKIQGPKGVGALWHSKAIDPLAVGGGQESGIRSGTENLFGIHAFALCAAKAAASLDERLLRARALERLLLDGIGAIPGACAVPPSRVADDPRWSPWIVSAAFPGLGGEVLARALSDVDIAVSTGSACSQAHKTKGRRVLDAMGLPEELSFSSIRLSFGPDTADADVEAFLSTAADLYRRLKT